MSVGDTTWYAIIMPGGSWETGLGTYTGTNTLARTTVLESSNGGAAVNFGAGSKDVFICQPASQAQPAFPSGTLMLFQQSSAPVYWTKQTTHNDKALRVVSGAASSGGSVAFSSAFSSQSVSNTTITTATMPSHAHGIPTFVAGNNSVTINLGAAEIAPQGNQTISATNVNGGDGTHSHTINMAVTYVDLIIAMKD